MMFYWPVTSMWIWGFGDFGISIKGNLELIPVSNALA